MMRRNLVSVMMFLILITTPIINGGSDLVESSCKRTPNYELCVKVISADPRSRGTDDITTLAIIMVDAIKAKSQETASMINNLQKTREDLKTALEECALDYKVILTASIPEAYEALTKGIPKFAEKGVVASSGSAQQCELGFQKSQSPLTALNTQVYCYRFYKWSFDEDLEALYVVCLYIQTAKTEGKPLSSPSVLNDVRSVRIRELNERQERRRWRIVGRDREELACGSTEKSWRVDLLRKSWRMDLLRRVGMRTVRL
nr:cell wall / vacuolar inhibitor of fructosidase 1-like [Ipomoea batatas]